jgi:hypothetical protein
VGYVECIGGIINLYNLLVGKPEQKGRLGRPRHSWEENIRTDRRKKGWECVDWMHLAQNTDQWRINVNTVMKLGVPQKVGNFLIS